MKTAAEHATAAITYTPQPAHIDKTIDSYICHLKRRMMRARSNAKRPGTLAEKLAAQRKTDEAENALRHARRLIFDIEDAVRDQLNNCRHEEESQKFKDS